MENKLTLNQISALGIIFLILLLFFTKWDVDTKNEEKLRLNLEEYTSRAHDAYTEIYETGILSDLSRSRLESKIHENFPLSKIESNKVKALKGEPLFLRISVLSQDSKGKIVNLHEIFIQGIRKEN